MNPETDAISDAGVLGDLGCVTATATSGNELCRLLIHRLSELEADRARPRHLSHELKTPLAALREGVSLLRDEIVGPLTAEQREVTASWNTTPRYAMPDRGVAELPRNSAGCRGRAAPSRRSPSPAGGVVASHRLQLQGQKLSVTIDRHLRAGLSRSGQDARRAF